MVFAAERDPLVPPDRVLPRARVLFRSLVAAEQLPGCHHILTVACSEAFCTRIRPFLAQGARHGTPTYEPRPIDAPRGSA